MAADESAAMRWLTSNKNIAGTVLGIGALALFPVTGPIAIGLVPVMYAVGALAMPNNKSQEMAKGLDPDDVAKSLKSIKRAVRNKVSPPVESRVKNICASIEQLLPRANELGPASEEMHLLVRMATDYLPNALAPYLKLPRNYAEQRPLANGQTAEAILCSQLDVMYEQMDEITDAVLRADGNKLLANGRFLEQKFGSGGLELPGD